MQNGVPQNPGELNKRVEELAKTFMKSANWSNVKSYQKYLYHPIKLFIHMNYYYYY